MQDDKPEAVFKPRKKTRRALERMSDIIDRLIAEGKTREEADEIARAQMRDNPRANWKEG